MAANTTGNVVKVENLRDVQRELRRAADSELKKELRAANKEAAEVVAFGAMKNAPQRSGDLAASIRATAGQSSGDVKAGSTSRVPYAGVIHYGWPARNIRPQPFIIKALKERKQQVIEQYQRAMDRFAAIVNQRL